MAPDMPLNILLIHADQYRFDCVGVNGHPLLRTPRLDRLAAEGANFTHAFCAVPVCSPARNSLLYGCWPNRHRVIANHDTDAARVAPEGLPTFSGALRDAGYRLSYVGKWGVHPGKTPLDFGFHEYVPEGAYAPWRREQGLPEIPRDGGWFGNSDPFITPEQSRLGWGADRTIEMLERCAAGDAPFFVRWDPSEPHLPNVVPEPYASLYPPAEIPPWSGFDDPLEGKPYIQAQQRRSWQVDGWTWDDWSPTVGRYLGEIALLDREVGRVLDALERLGLADSTLVVFSSDHGDMCGSHGMLDKHYILYDDVVRVPLIARLPGAAPTGNRDAFVSSGIDLAATFCDAAGVPCPETFEGSSLLPLLKGEGGGRANIFSAYHGSQFGLYSQRMVRERRWKYIWNATAEDELYDLETDPGEIHNRARHLECAGELARLRRELIEWMRRTGDPLLNRWTETQLREGLTT